ncbi:aldehyde dehydrogenase family protein [Blastococcus sp. CCUG 61487]|uniref:aldehyde dehydrogenase family protein n=1 Tax=Blastococcus sp. CCUG 61487 TaxID=1840703 RepID=UPI0011384259|nr:aldehyde dehydrogenase family protein [Blastococcus sp. CCUG 61487]TKJ20011.1 aldehyde dehydrogenase [Blastococcus sp. CCUG 61487]
MTQHLMTINGESRDAAQRFDVINPATGEPFATAPEADAAILDDAMAGAQQAFRSWKLDDDARREALRLAAKALGDATPQIATLLTQEQGKPLGEAMFEVMGVGMWLQYYADLEVEREIVQDDDAAFVEVVRRPIGVVAAIAPWNFPLLLSSWKIAPALRAGNTVVLKPSPYTPLSSLAMVAVLNQALPPGVLNVVTGGDSLGAAMTAHPTPRKVSFTGSVSAGKKVAIASAADLKRVTLELGGNDPAIVLDDVDPAVVGKQLFSAAFQNNGQTCIAVKRVYVPESLHDAVVDALVAEAESVVVGDGMDEATKLGPVQNRPQFDRVAALVQGALASGAKAAAGGAALERPGYFFAPTILTDAADGTEIVDEEQFGPALPVIPYSDLDEAVERANATTYGLGASVWATDTERGEAVARQLDAGSAWVNTHAALAPNLPFGGLKWSGIGVENGPWGLKGFTDMQVVHRRKQ